MMFGGQNKLVEQKGDWTLLNNALRDLKKRCAVMAANSEITQYAESQTTGKLPNKLQ